MAISERKTITTSDLEAALTTETVKDVWGDADFHLEDSAFEMHAILHQDGEGFDRKRFYYFRDFIANASRSSSHRMMHKHLRPALVTPDNHPMVPRDRFDGKDALYGDNGVTAIYYVRAKDWLKWRALANKHITDNVASLAADFSQKSMEEAKANSKSGGAGGFGQVLTPAQAMTELAKSKSAKLHERK